MPYLPLKKAITDYISSGAARFHMPGHKGMNSPFDVTEVSGTDNLHDPHEAILESEALCAKALGARDAFFSVSGSTACMMAMLRLAGLGKRVLLGRNCHKSAINGIALSGLETVSIFPDQNGVVSAEAVAAALDKAPCDAVFITSPTYRGTVSTIAEIAEAAHARGALLFVDAAHGAHFAFSDDLPPAPSAADLWCVSTHKTLAAFTQTAVLLSGKSCPFSRNEIVEALSLFQSTSPSYPMMLSIESSVLEPADWDAHTERVKSLRSRLESIEGICLVPEDLGVISDPTRLNVICRGLSGYELQKALEVESIVPEMSDRECVTLITSPADPDEWYERLYSALSVISGKSGDNGKASEYSPVIIRPGETLLSVRDALFAPFEYIPLKDAVGRISARPAGCYPPGVAVLFPGERITAENAEFLIRERSSGAELFGINNGCAAVLK